MIAELLKVEQAMNSHGLLKQGWHRFISKWTKFKSQKFKVLVLLDGSIEVVELTDEQAKNHLRLFISNFHAFPAMNFFNESEEVTADERCAAVYSHIEKTRKLFAEFIDDERMKSFKVLLDLLTPELMLAIWKETRDRIEEMGGFGKSGKDAAAVYFDLAMDVSGQSVNSEEAFRCIHENLRGVNDGEKDMFGGGGAVVESSFAKVNCAIGLFSPWERNKDCESLTNYGMLGFEAFPMRKETEQRITDVMNVLFSKGSAYHWTNVYGSSRDVVVCYPEIAEPELREKVSSRFASLMTERRDVKDDCARVRDSFWKGTLSESEMACPLHFFSFKASGNGAKSLVRSESLTLAKLKERASLWEEYMTHKNGNTVSLFTTLNKLNTKYGRSCKSENGRLVMSAVSGNRFSTEDLLKVFLDGSKGMAQKMLIHIANHHLGLFVEHSSLSRIEKSMVQSSDFWTILRFVRYLMVVLEMKVDKQYAALGRMFKNLDSLYSSFRAGQKGQLIEKSKNFIWAAMKGSHRMEIVLKAYNPELTWASNEILYHQNEEVKTKFGWFRACLSNATVNGIPSWSQKLSLVLGYS